MRKIPTATLTGWTLVSGIVYRTLDRTDNSTMIVRADGVQLTDQVDTTTPTLNAWGLNGGYVYINVGGDPSTKLIESDMPPGYGITFYWTQTGYPGMNCNRADITVSLTQTASASTCSSRARPAPAGTTAHPTTS